MTQIAVRVNIRYSTGALSGGNTYYDQEIDITTDGADGTEPLLVDSPITYSFNSGFRPWSKSRSSSSFGSVKVYDQTWLNDVNELSDRPPLVRLYVTIDDNPEEKVYDGKSYQSKYLGESVYEIMLAPFTEILNEPLAGEMILGLNPSVKLLPPLFIGRQAFQAEPMMYDYANNVYLICSKENNGPTYSISGVRDNGDLLALTTDYSLSTITIDSNDYQAITLVSPAVGKLTVDITGDSSTTNQIYQSVGLMMDYREIDYDSVTDNAAGYYTTKYGQNIAQHGWMDYGTQTVKDVMDLMAESVTSCWHSKNGKDYYLDPLKVPEDEASILTIDKDNLLSEVTSDVDTAPNLSLRIGGRVNHFVFRDTEVAAGATQAEKDTVTSKARVTVDLAQTLAQHSVPDDNFVTVGATHRAKQFKEMFLSTFTASNNNKIKAQVAHLCNLYGNKTRRFYKCSVTMNLLSLSMGDIVEIDYNDIENKKVQVVGISGDLRENTLKLILWG